MGLAGWGASLARGAGAGRRRRRLRRLRRRGRCALERSPHPFRRACGARAFAGTVCAVPSGAPWGANPRDHRHRQAPGQGAR
eukprot:3150029-Lingulodinium_polyedra.AAC.1